MNEMYKYLKKHSYISENKKSNSQFELSEERAECIANKYDSLLKKQQEIIDKVKDYCHSEIDKCKYEQSDDEWECCIEELKRVLSILEDKELKGE